MLLKRMFIILPRVRLTADYLYVFKFEWKYTSRLI